MAALGPVRKCSAHLGAQQRKYQWGNFQRDSRGSDGQIQKKSYKVMRLLVRSAPVPERSQEQIFETGRMALNLRVGLAGANATLLARTEEERFVWKSQL